METYKCSLLFLLVALNYHCGPVDSQHLDLVEFTDKVSITLKISARLYITETSPFKSDPKSAPYI